MSGAMVTAHPKGRIPKSELAEVEEYEAVWKQLGYRPNPAMRFDMLGEFRYPGDPVPTLKERLRRFWRAANSD